MEIGLVAFAASSLPLNFQNGARFSKTTSEEYASYYNSLQLLINSNKQYILKPLVAVYA